MREEWGENELQIAIVKLCPFFLSYTVRHLSDPSMYLTTSVEEDLAS